MRMDGDGEIVREGSEVLVSLLSNGGRTSAEAVKKMSQIVSHISMRWELWTYSVVKERMAMAM